MWIWTQDDGVMLDILCGRFATGYAGFGDGKNSHAHQHIRDVGPIPCGQYTIGQAIDHPRLGPLSMRLAPAPGNNMYGRDDFWIHGDNGKGTASHGCIVLAQPARMMISRSEDRILIVIPRLWRTA